MITVRKRKDIYRASYKYLHYSPRYARRLGPKELVKRLAEKGIYYKPTKLAVFAGSKYAQTHAQASPSTAAIVKVTTGEITIKPSAENRPSKVQVIEERQPDNRSAEARENYIQQIQNTQGVKSKTLRNDLANYSTSQEAEQIRSGKRNLVYDSVPRKSGPINQTVGIKTSETVVVPAENDTTYIQPFKSTYVAQPTQKGVKKVISLLAQKADKAEQSRLFAGAGEAFIFSAAKQPVSIVSGIFRTVTNPVRAVKNTAAGVSNLIKNPGIVKTELQTAGNRLYSQPYTFFGSIAGTAATYYGFGKIAQLTSKAVIKNVPAKSATSSEQLIQNTNEAASAQTNTGGLVQIGKRTYKVESTSGEIITKTSKNTADVQGISFSTVSRKGKTGTYFTYSEGTASTNGEATLVYRELATGKIKGNKVSKIFTSQSLGTDRTTESVGGLKTSIQRTFNANNVQAEIGKGVTYDVLSTKQSGLTRTLAQKEEVTSGYTNLGKRGSIGNNHLSTEVINPKTKQTNPTNLISAAKSFSPGDTAVSAVKTFLIEKTSSNAKLYGSLTPLIASQDEEKESFSEAGSPTTPGELNREETKIFLEPESPIKTSPSITPNNKPLGGTSPKIISRGASGVIKQTKPSTRSEIRVDVTTATDSAAKTNPKLSQGITSESITPTSVTPPFPTPPTYMPPVPILRRTKNISPKKVQSGFAVLVRRGGEFKRIKRGVSFSRSDATALGRSVVGRSAAATFKLVYSSEPLNNYFGPRGIASDFEEKDGLFIEKRGRRIKSFGEKQQITLKGIQATRRSGKNGIFQ